MSRNVLSKFLEYIGVVLFLGCVYILIQWVTISFMITRTGTIKWAEGWDELVKYWCQ